MSPASRSCVHLCVVQPPGYVHSMGLLDAARYFRHQFQQMGVEASIAKNRLRYDMPNLVFGAHLGFEPALARMFCCIFVNLEQLGPGGSAPSAAYLELLRGARVVDYEPANAAHYGQQPADVPIVAFGYAPYLAPAAPALPLEQRQFDLLFFGSINERRRRLIERIERSGRTVVVFDAPVYGPERDAFVVRSRAVLNCHYYDTARFEQVRAFQVLSLGTPLVSERTERTSPGRHFERSVDWFDEQSLERFFTDDYPTPAFAQRAQAKLCAFREHNPITDYAHALEFARAAYGATRSAAQPAPNAQRLLHIGSGKDYRPGWLNVDIQDQAQPDVRLDLSRPHAWPLALNSPFWGPVQLRAGATELIFANNVLEHVADLPTLMGNCLALLRTGGKMVVEVPYEASLGAWQDPTHVRAMNENSWLYYTDWFWYLGWMDHRFQVREFRWLDANHAPCAKPAAAFMNVTLEKVPTTVAERMTARTMRPDFGGLIEPVGPPPAAAPVPVTVPERAAPPGVALDAGADAAAPGTGGMPAASAPARAEMSAKLLTRLPAVASVIEFGCGEGELGARYKATNPQARWLGVDRDARALAGAAARLDAIAQLDLDDAALQLPQGRFDLIVVGGILARLRDPLAFLVRLGALCHERTQLVCVAPNMSHYAALEQLLIGDLSSGTEAAAPRMLSPRALVKLFLDAGWLPQLVDCNAFATHSPALAHLIQAAQALGCPPKTAVRNLALDRLVFECRRAPRAAAPAQGPARFAVIVPVTNALQLQLNVLQSPGLRELGAEVIQVSGASSAAAGLLEGAARTQADWVLYCHQDVYLPRGSGAMLNELIAELEASDHADPVVGFAGVSVDGEGKVRYSGLCVDRLDCFDHAESLAAVSLDECAILLRRDSKHRIDAALGWHLWATDLCLQAFFADRRSARIVRIPIYHNSFNDHVHGEPFHNSVRLLKAKYPQYAKIATIAAGVV